MGMSVAIVRMGICMVRAPMIRRVVCGTWMVMMMSVVVWLMMGNGETFILCQFTFVPLSWYICCATPFAKVACLVKKV